MLCRNCRPLLQLRPLRPLPKTYTRFLLPGYRLNSTIKPPTDSTPPQNGAPAGTTPPVDEFSKSSQRFEKVFNRTPKFLRNWLRPIANAPLSHITAFLILHEVTAIIPLVGLTYIFHKAQWTPAILPGEWLVQGVEKGAKLIRHYGINVKGDQFMRLAFEFAAAYASVKALMPLRIALSVWLTPWFARFTVLPFIRLFRRKKTVAAAPDDKAAERNGAASDTKDV